MNKIAPLNATALGRFVVMMRQRGRFGTCCVCGGRRPHLSISFEPNDVETVELRVCDHICSYKLGMLSAEAIRGAAPPAPAGQLVGN